MVILDYGASKEDGSLEKYIRETRLIDILKKRRINGLREIQKLAVEQGIFFRENFLICTPSGSGKTLIGELAIGNTVFQGDGKSVYLAPYRAIAIEKYHMFRKEYGPYGIQAALCIGDVEVEPERLIEADIIITTYEKLDALLRTCLFQELNWVNYISSVVIDEIHVIGHQGRGARLESLIIRIMELPRDIQIIALSATIANPGFFCEWLSSLGKEFIMIKSTHRPVPLQYKIEIVNNKDSAIRKHVKQLLAEGGQGMVFVNKRKTSISMTQKLMKTTAKTLDSINLANLERSVQKLEKNPNSSSQLQEVLPYGIAFHNASLIQEDKSAVEDAYQNRDVKVICCTTTLSAGVNTPAREVFIRNFEQYIPNIFVQSEEMHYSPEYCLRPSKHGVFVPIPNNQFFQILGRAGRPGQDTVGKGTIFVSDQEEFDWVISQYFKIHPKTRELTPNYGDLTSALNNTILLQEQILLLICAQRGICYRNLVHFLEKTYFWYCFPQKDLPVEQILRIRNFSLDTLLQLHFSEKHIATDYTQARIQIQLFDAKHVEALVTLKGRNQLVNIHIEKGFVCSCNHSKNNSILKMKQKFNYEFCIHLGLFLHYIRTHPNSNFQRHVEHLIKLASEEAFVIDYLLDHEFIYYEKKTGMLKPTNFGLLAIQLYITPKQMVWVRQFFEDMDIESKQELLEAAFDFFQERNPTSGNDLLLALQKWIAEKPLKEIIYILQPYHGMGDFAALKSNLVRVLHIFQAVADHYERYEIEKFAQQLELQITYGVAPELFDLVVKLPSVNRTLGRRLYRAGYRDVVSIYESTIEDLARRGRIAEKKAVTIYNDAVALKTAMRLT